jgi:glutamate-1-semialdehyde aminotransferase
MPNSIKFNDNYPSIRESNALYWRAIGLIPAVTQTLAKGPGQYVNGIAPKFLQKGLGAYVWDVDGNQFLDYNMAIGPLSLGYSYPSINAAIRRQLEDGITFSMMHPLEVEVAELIREIIPNAQSVRFSKTGADVTSAAVRLARAYTGREKVLCCGYHGWHDWYIAVTDRNGGVPEVQKNMTYTFNYNDIESLEESIDRDVACVIMEPVVFEAPNDQFLHKVKDICSANGSLLIFDEMWTGFRLALGGAQAYFDIDADLATFSKAVANGMPLSILSGRAAIMDLLNKDVFFYTTFGGEALSLAAAKATILELKHENVPAYLDEKGRRLKEGYNEIAAGLGMDYTRCIGFNCRTMVTFDPNAGDLLLMKSIVQQEMIKRGILWAGFHNLSYSHRDEDIDYTLKAYREVLTILARAVSSGDLRGFLKGTPVEPVFRKTSHFNTNPRKKIA